MSSRIGIARIVYPLLRLALLVGLSVALSLVDAWVFLAVAGGTLVALTLILGLPKAMSRMLIATFLLGLPMLFLVFFLSGREATGSWSTAFRWGLIHLVPYALRIGDLVLANLLFIRTTSLAEIMTTLKGLRLPEPVVLYSTTLLRFIPQILLETRRVVDAQRCRGLTRRRMLTPSGLLAIFVPLFLSQIHRSRDLAMSLEIRSSAFSSRLSSRNIP